MDRHANATHPLSSIRANASKSENARGTLSVHTRTQNKQMGWKKEEASHCRAKQIG